MQDFLKEFPWNRFERAVVLSPHPDDAVFSCTGLIAALKDRLPFTVMTLACGMPDAEAHAAKVKQRRTEDSKALGMLGVNHLQVGFLDAPFRQDASGRFLYRGRVTEDLGLDAGDGEHVKRLISFLRSVILGQGKTLLVSPLGIGGHVDHILARNVACALLGASTRGDLQLLFYEDFPYVSRIAPDTLEVLSIHRSCLEASGLRLEGAFFVETDIELKSECCWTYETQAPGLFGTREELIQRLRPVEVYCTPTGS
jgi:LmbE family N-acetylglucosaminyl deacetylase